MEEMPFDANGNLPEGVDPKLGWAKINLAENPVEINQASRNELLHIPGIGPKGVQTLLSARRKLRLQSMEQLRRIGINPTRAAPYILLDGKRPGAQLSLL
jgi:predicted DNA-binding helix-hairpin-helix protein